MLHILQLILDRATVADRVSEAPGHDRSIAKNGSKSIFRGLDLLHIFQLILRRTYVAPKGSITPGRNRPIAKNSSTSRRSAQNLNSAYMQDQPVTVVNPGIRDLGASSQNDSR